MLAGGPGDLMVNAQNFAANKIDLFTQTNLAVDVTVEGCRVQGGLTPHPHQCHPGRHGFHAASETGQQRPLDGERLRAARRRHPGPRSERPAGGAYLEEFGRTVVSVIVDADLGASRHRDAALAGGSDRARLHPDHSGPARGGAGDPGAERADPVRFVETLRREFPEAARLSELRGRPEPDGSGGDRQVLEAVKGLVPRRPRRKRTGNRLWLSDPRHRPPRACPGRSEGEGEFRMTVGGYLLCQRGSWARACAVG